MAKTAPIEQPAPPAPVVVRDTSRRLPGLAVAGITLGGVIVAGALFGGGIVLGEHITGPGHSGFGTHQGFSTGPNGFGGPGPVVPGQGGNHYGPQGGERGGQQGSRGSDGTGS